MKIKLITTTTSLFAAAMLAAAVPAFAQIDQPAAGVNPSARAIMYASTTRPNMMSPTMRPVAIRVEGRMGSSTRPFAAGAGIRASTTEQRMQNGEDRGDTMISARINSLGQLLARIQGMLKLSGQNKTSFQTSIQAEIDALTSLKAKVDADTSTTTLKDDLQSVTKSYRVYALIEPQAQIAAASDRILNIVGMLGTVVTKAQVRISSDTTLSSNTTIQTDLTDITSKNADASTQANAAVTETYSLQPDNGNTTIAASNTAALKDARTKIQTAESDLQVAEKDIQTIVKIIVQSDKNLGVSASASTTTR